ncbi:MAG: hypothetical protein ACPGLV_09570 [Bacteroidia bacterium]
MEIVALVLLGSSTLFGQSEYISQLREHDQQHSNLLDSLTESFKSTNNANEKKMYALQLFNEYNFTNARRINLSKKLNVDTHSIALWQRPYKTYLIDETNVLSRAETNIEFKLLGAKNIIQLEKIIDALNRASLNPAIDSLFRAIALKKINHLKSKGKGLTHKVKGLKKVLKLLPKKSEYQFIFNSVCQQLGYYYYHQLQLDSAELYYKIPCELSNGLAKKKYHYIRGEGVRKSTANLGTCLMNMGLINERKGNLITAVDYYEKANLLFKNQNGFNKQWSEMRLSNAFFDLGDTQSGMALLRTISSVNLNYLRSLKRYGPHIIISQLAEMDLYQLKEHAIILDSVMRVELKHFYQGNQKSERVNNKNKPFYYSNRAELALWDCIFQIIIPNREPFFENNELQKCFEISREINFERETNERQKNAIEIYYLAFSTVAKTYNNNFFEQAINKYANDADIIGNLQSLRKASYYLNCQKAFEAELVILNKIIPVLEKTTQYVELSKTYKQIANCYEKLGDYKKCIISRNKYDSISAEIRQVNQHANLAKLDKELQVSRALKDKALADKLNESLTYKKNNLTIITVSVLVILALLVVLFFINRKRILSDRKRLAVENDNLETKLKLEEEKLQRASLEIIKSNQSLSDLIKDVENLKGNLSHQNRTKLLGLLIEYRAKLQDENWQQFNLEFQSMNEGFYEKIQNEFNLTKNEKRLCAMHLSGLSNQEINAITGQKLSSVHTMKSKIRKKLGVENDEDLLDLLKSLNQTN